MYPPDVSNASPAGTEWQILGVLVLTIDQNAKRLLTLWLRELLAPLQLQADFLDKLLSSAHNSVESALQPNVSVTFDHIHFSVFAPKDHTSRGSIWGFFRIEKLDDIKPRREPPEHAIEFYLYKEGKRD